MLEIGSLVDRKYKILNEIGRGGMSVVYLAINERANKTWAVKEIRKDGVCNFEAVKQGLVVETDMLKKLDHPHLPSIIDVIDTDDSFLIVMDYIEGQSLQKILKTSGAQPKELVVEWGKQLCDVLGYLHSREPAIIYRDMKPANVMLKHDGTVTLIDFGTAREFKNRAMVEDTTCLGTRGYAAPEQFGGRGQTDARTDIYCLGATLYHLITGHSPAEPPYEIKPLSYWDPNMQGSGLEYIINKCCQQDPAARYQSCAELMYDLDHVNEIDSVTQKSRKHKWAAFVASLVICGVGVAGMIGSAIGMSHATTQTYDFHLAKAQMLVGEEKFPEFLEEIQQAQKVNPGRYEAYDMLLSRVEEDGRLDMQKEYSPIQTALLDTLEGYKRPNEEYLRSSDVEGYADIQFRVGKLLFLMTNGENSNLRESTAYFNKALKEGELEQAAEEDETAAKRAKLAGSLATIGQSIGALNNHNATFLDSKYNYAALWGDLNTLIQDNPIDSMGSRAYGIALYNRVGSMVTLYYEDFSAEGIAWDDMLSLLDTIGTSLEKTKNSLSDSEKNRGFLSLIESAENNVKTAENMIDGKMGGNR